MKAPTKLPIGVQSFEKIITEDYVYVDKTELLFQLITSGNVYFLSRPRRFGKSLLMSTLNAIFQGKKHLFKGLWIEGSDYSWNEYPVIYLDMSRLSNVTPEQLQESLLLQLNQIAEQYKISLMANITPSDALNMLIERLSQLGKVVVLVDEYDKPLLDQINNQEVAISHRDTLKQFYGNLKSQDQNLRFVMLTGVSKFSKVSVFSGLNNLEDISLTEKYASLLGYTQKQLEHYFHPWIQDLAKKENFSLSEILTTIKRWYNGYRFSRDETTLVYNPFSTLLLFKQQMFIPHWFATGTPTFLINLIDERKFDVTALEKLEVQESTFTVYEVDHLEIIPLLYQTGYLTIQGYNKEFGSYILGYPNFEVEQAFVNNLLARFTRVEKSEQDVYLFRLVKALKRMDFEEFFKALKQYLTEIPYELHMKKELYYQNIFYLLLTLVGLTLHAEVHTNRGRIDAVIELEDRVYIFEFKLDKSAREALDQIKQRGYAEHYLHKRKALYLLGVNFSTLERNLESWLLETL